MDSQKVSDQLALALSIPKIQLERSGELGEGFNITDKTWELIVKYNGDLIGVVNSLGGAAELLFGNFAVVVIGEDMVDEFVARPEVEFIEKPNRLYFAINQAVRASCIEPVLRLPLGLSGRGVIVAIIDSGIDWRHRDFINFDGTSRILKLWDQTVPASASGLTPPTGYIFGTEYTNEKINEALRGEETAIKSLALSRDYSGHGTFVAGEAAGNGRESEGIYRGVAYESNLLVVKLGDSIRDEYPRTTRLMEAVNYVVEQAAAYNMPVAINLSFGNNQGSHDGTDLLSTYLDSAAGVWKSSIVCGSGNEAGAGNHAHGIIQAGRQERIEWSVGEYEASLSLGLWKNYADSFVIELVSPSGERIRNINSGLGTYRFNNTDVYINYGEPKPFSRFQQIYFEFIPSASYIDAGVWTLIFTPERIVDGQYDAWLPESQTVNADTGFFYPDEETTLTVPSAASKVITVGAYNSRTNAYADFSGRGYTRTEKAVKPDIVAPGVNIVSTAVGGGYTVKTGTSMAAPIVTGSAALMMQWGIIEGNDRYLYGEKIKACLIKGAKPLSGSEKYPNPRTGWGALCLADSFPRG